jgi:hypothetical protein
MNLYKILVPISRPNCFTKNYKINDAKRRKSLRLITKFVWIEEPLKDKR